MTHDALSIAELKGKVDFGIITIREDESDAVLQRLPLVQLVAGRQRYAVSRLQTISEDEYVLACARCLEPGTGQAQEVARTMIDELNPQWILVVGIAGSVPDYEYTLGDVLLASRLHDFSVSAIIEKSDGLVRQEFASAGGPMHPDVQTLLAALPALNLVLEKWYTPASLTVPRPEVKLGRNNFYGEDDWKRKVKECLSRYFGKTSIRQQPKAFTASVASSGILLKDTQTASLWVRTARDIKGVEMELSGVYQAAWPYQKPILAIRGISDIVGFKRSPDWTTYACHTAAAFTIALLRSRPIIPLESKEQSRGIEADSDMPSVGSVGARINFEHVQAGGGIFALLGDVNIDLTPSVASLHQIPPPPHNLTGREAELNELLAEHDQSGARLFGLDGMAGVGKTALARGLSEKLTLRYPDAQINLDLKGLSPQPLSVADAIAHVIRSFHPTIKLPNDESAIAGLYQTVLHGKRVLLLMENAASNEQVEALIPPRGTTLIVTSRQRLAVGGMSHKHIQTLSPDAAQSLLLKVAPRVGNAATEIANLCGNLPFALRLAAGVLATRIDLDPADYVRRMSDARRRSQLIDASLSLSYELLEPEVKSLWCALSIFPGTFDLEAATDIWGLEPDAGREAISTLVSLNLVEWLPSSSRYRLHDLVRAFTDRELPEEEHQRNERRFFNHYLEVFFGAEQLYREGGDATRRGLDLYDLERANIEAAQSWIVAHAEDDDTAAAVCAHYPLHGSHLLRMRVHPLERIRLYEVALAAARRVGTRDAEGTLIYLIGLAYDELGDFRRAIKFARQYLKIAREMGDQAREASALSALGQAYKSKGFYRRAIILFSRALDIRREQNDRRYESTEMLYLGQAYQAIGESKLANEMFLQVLNIAQELGIRQNQGSALACLAGLHIHHGCEDAFTYAEQALSIFREIGYKPGEAGILDTLGQLHTSNNDHRRGISVQEEALALARHLGDLAAENKILGNIGLAYAAMGEHQHAIDYYQQQLDIARRIKDYHGEGNGLINMAKAYIGLGHPDRAIDPGNQSMTIFRMIGSRKSECGGYAILGEAYKALGQWEPAADYYMQRARFAREIGHRGCEAESYFDIAKIYYDAGARAEGVVCAQCALMIQEKIDPPRVADVREQLAAWLNERPFRGERKTGNEG